MFVNARLWHDAKLLLVNDNIRTYPPSGRVLLIVLMVGTLTAGCGSSYSKEQEQDMRAVRNAITADRAKLNAPDTQGNTPLHFAVLNNYLPLMDWLSERGVDPNTPGRYGNTPLHLAISTDRTPGGAVILKLLSMGADVNATNEYGETPLHLAASHGLTGTVHLLLKNHADVNRRARRGETALLYAARPEGYPETVLALIEEGADVNAVDNVGMTPLHGAAMIGNVNVARVLLEKSNADVNRQTAAGYTPLHVAALSGKADFVRFLLEKGADRTIRDNEGLTSEERAVRFPAMRYDNNVRAPVDTAAAVNLLRTYQASPR
jgi:ankyrin repeat protein